MKPDEFSIQIGVIGCGRWGPNHIRIFSQLKNVIVKAVADSDKERLSEISESFGNVRCHTKYDELLCDDAIEAVVVATPTATHFEIVSAALTSGKHVLCEKPLCDDVSDGQHLVALAEQRKLVLMVGHTFLFNPGIKKMKELIDLGEIGAVRSLSAVRTNLGPVRSDVNAAWDLASHDIAIFNWLLGSEPLELQAMGAAFLQPGIEDVVNTTMRYSGNVLASIQCSWLDPKKVRQITIVGSKRMMTWNDLDLANPVAIYEKTIETNSEVTGYGEFLRLSMLDGDVRLPKVEADEPLRAQDSAFVRAIRDGTRPPSDGAFGVGVIRVLELVKQALVSGRTMK